VWSRGSEHPGVRWWRHRRDKCATRDGRLSLPIVLDLRFGVACLHLDQGGDEKSDYAFPLVVLLDDV